MRPDEKRRRCRHTPVFKAAGVAACRRAGPSVAAIALELRLIANMRRAWIEQSTTAPAVPVPAPPLATPKFLPLKFETRAKSASTPSSTSRPLLVHIRGGRSRISIEWPAMAAGAWAGRLQDLVG